MSTPGIIIMLSGKKISLEYIREDGAGVPAPFPRGNWPMPLSAFSRKAKAAFGTDLVFDITDRLKTLFEETLSASGELESLKESLPIVILIENDVTDEEGDSIKESFKKLGYSNVAILRPDLLAADYYRREYHPQGVVTVNSDGTDLYISLSLDSQPGGVARKVMPGDGYDPRTEALAVKIWEQVRDYTIDLRMENEMAALERAALEYLSSGRSEMEGSVRLSDGGEYDFFVNRSMVNNDGTRKIQSALAEFLTEFGLADRSRSVLVLRGDAIGSNYLKQSLTPGFGEVAEMSGNLRDAVIRLALYNAAGMVQTEIVKPEKEPISNLRPEPAKQTFGFASPQPTIPTEQRTTDNGQPEKGNAPMPIKIEATVETVKAGFLKKKKVLKVRIEGEGSEKLKWHSVLCIQEKPLSTVEMENVVKDYDRGSKLPFSHDIDLPLKQCPDAKKLRIYFKPHPDEPVGINNAYEVAPYTVNLG